MLIRQSFCGPGRDNCPALLGRSGPSLDLGTGPIRASDHVRLLGVTISSLEKHISGICSTCFYWLRQIRRIRRSLDTRVRNDTCTCFITSRVDYCNVNIVLAGSPRFITEYRQASACVECCSTSHHSLVRGSLTAACLICSTLTCIGWTSINVFSISSESQFNGASRIVKRNRTRSALEAMRNALNKSTALLYTTTRGGDITR